MARRGNQTREGDDGGWNKEKDNIGLNDIGQGNVGLKDIGKDDLGQDQFWTALNEAGQDLACANRAGFVSFCFQ